MQLYFYFFYAEITSTRSMFDEIWSLFWLFNLISVVGRIGKFKPGTVMLSLVVFFISPISAMPVNGQDLNVMMVKCGSEFCNITNQYCDTQVSQCKRCAPLCANSDDAHQSSCQKHCGG